ncbi:MAG TPA: class I SAM-dependent methyltransferase [Verrucomicrobiae bacterium]|jgi:caffeoyl-CoA O-methyltransferase|nr:class I SAM-dependent methyltransferase [Verrucomicrobiae bacterium]
MSSKNTPQDERIHAFILKTTVRESDVLRALRDETSKRSNAGMQIGPEQGQFMALLARAIGARRYLEIGVFTGYSSLAVAAALPADGHVTACDVSEEFTSVATAYWQRAGVAEKIDLRLAPALETLDSLLAAGQAGTYDLAFIDADKPNYDGYYERSLQLVRTNGLILIDNMLWSGDVADPSVDDESTNALRALDVKVGKDERVDCTLLAICDGLMVVRKRA